MKKMIGVICWCMLAGLTVQANLIVSNRVDSSDGWVIIGGGGFTNSAGGLSPVSGTNFFNAHTTSSYVNMSLYKDFGITLKAGSTYHITVALGDKDNAVFVPTSSPATPFASSALAFGFFTNTVSTGADVRNAIQALGANADITVTNFIATVPVTGWQTWSYDLTVAEGSSLDGVAVYFGLGWNSQGSPSGARGIAFDDLAISVVPEPATISLFMISSISMLLIRHSIASRN